MAGALIVTAELGRADFAWLNEQRRRYFPPERNHLDAHLTMFHALPPSLEEDVRQQLKSHSAGSPPRASIAGLMNLGGGVAYRVVSPDLESIREAIAAHFHGALTAQDAGGWKAHVTVQNKVSSSEARQLLEKLEAGFTPRSIVIRGLALHRYLGGPWERLGRWSFRG